MNKNNNRQSISITVPPTTIMSKDEMKKELDGFILVKHKIGWEGFDYCFRHYSTFKDDISDEYFHELRVGYLKGSIKQEDVNNYIHEKIVLLEFALN